MGERIVIPGPRDVRGTLDGCGEACVVAAPPHPQYGGSRTDRRLRAEGKRVAELAGTFLARVLGNVA